jgi:hypothetical protein
MTPLPPIGAPLDLNNGYIVSPQGDQYCTNNGKRCVDGNYNQNAIDAWDVRSIARVASMMFDLFDGPAPERVQTMNSDGTTHLGGPATAGMNNADSWTFDTTVNALTYSPVNYGSQDEKLETVQLAAKGLVDYAAALAAGLGDGDFGTGTQIDDAKVYKAANSAMMTNGVSSWCDRCRVMGIHSPLRGDDNSIGNAFAACNLDSTIKASLAQTSPEPNGRIAAATCTACPANQFSNADGVCQACPGTIMGNVCQACPIDYAYEGATMPIGHSIVGNASIAGDTCAGKVWVAVNHPQALFARGVPSLTVQGAPGSTTLATDCQKQFELDLGLLQAGVSGVLDGSAVFGFGVWSPAGAGELALNSCTGLPTKVWTNADVPTDAPLIFGMPASTTNLVTLDSSIPGPPPL